MTAKNRDVLEDERADRWMKKALPCPFCGGRTPRLEWLWAPQKFAVTCNVQRCFATGPLAISERGAVQRWNRAAR